MNTLLILILVSGILIIAFLFFKKSHTTNRNKFYPNTDSQDRNNLGQPFKHSIDFDESKTGIGKHLIFDLETTGLPKGSRQFIDNISLWPRIIQIAWLILDEEMLLVKTGNYYIKIPEKIPPQATRINGITNSMLSEKGKDPSFVFNEFIIDLKKCEYLISHNIDFDAKVLEVDLIKNNLPFQLQKKKMICTMIAGKKYFLTQPVLFSKNPKLTELYGQLYFGRTDISISEAHDAFADTCIAAKCFTKLHDIDKNTIKIFRNFKLTDSFYQYNITQIH